MSRKKGSLLEDKIERELRKAGLEVKRNKIVVVQGNSYEIDLVVQDEFYIESKYRSHGSLTLDEVAKFYSVLDMLGHDPKYAAICSNVPLNRRAESFAKRKHLYFYKFPEDLNLLKAHIFLVLGQYDHALKEFFYQSLKGMGRLIFNSFRNNLRK